MGTNSRKPMVCRDCGTSRLVHPNEQEPKCNRCGGTNLEDVESYRARQEEMLNRTELVNKSYHSTPPPPPSIDPIKMDEFPDKIESDPNEGQ